ncbi:5771_t:CDS:1 [Dentiscutata erythropus]|uniref:5771_t:CDS:1 n=1 Tax=Dentiscutata erythropus TaxID=1348616 RepID=A0A9N9NET2_9GLOM|nr:5771_t:CDS:1 [Dentiscutata erythropus]
MSENIFSYVSGETKIFNTSNENIKVIVEGINGDIARVFLADKNDKPYESTGVVFENATTEEPLQPVKVKDKESYLITWLYNYKLSMGSKLIFMLERRKEQKEAIISLAPFFKKN